MARRNPAEVVQPFKQIKIYDDYIGLTDTGRPFYPPPQGLHYDRFFGILQRDGKCNYVHFSRNRNRLFNVLFLIKTRPVSVDEAFHAVYHDIPEADWPESDKAMPVLANSVRRDIRPFDLTIATVREFGWVLTDLKNLQKKIR